MLPDTILAPRTDAVYNAHGYLTKVPVDAIIPFINEYTQPGETVVDMFAGSGMTAVAAKMAGRNAAVSDISVLGQHIGHGYLSEVDTTQLRQTARSVIDAAREKTAHLYQTRRAGDDHPCEMIRTVWSYVYQCDQCKCDIVYYDVLKANDWKAPKKCPHCDAAFAKKGKTVHAEKPVRVVVDGPNGKQMEQDIAKETGTSAKQYEKILTDACKEAYRILKPGHHLTVVFGNSKGTIWSMVQRALIDAGFEARPVHIGILDKGQRSVKGLNSGTESVATLDLIVTVRKPDGTKQPFVPAQKADIGSIVEKVVKDFKVTALPTPSHVYLTILKDAMSIGLSLEDLHLADVLIALRQKGYAVDQKTGKLQKIEVAA